jgi:hypothetical protein
MEANQNTENLVDCGRCGGKSRSAELLFHLSWGCVAQDAWIEAAINDRKRILASVPWQMLGVFSPAGLKVCRCQIRLSIPCSPLHKSAPNPPKNKEIPL